MVPNMFPGRLKYHSNGLKFYFDVANLLLAFHFFKLKTELLSSFSADNSNINSDLMIDLSKAIHRVVLFQSEKCQTRAELELLTNICNSLV